MSWHSVARSAHEGARSPSPGHWKWTCTRHLMAFPVGSMNLLQASRGQFELDRNFQAEFGVASASQGAMAMGSMNCHPGDPRLLGAFAEHPEALELRGFWWCYTIYTAAWSVEVPWINTYYMSTCGNYMYMDMDNDMYNIYICMYDILWI